MAALIRIAVAAALLAMAMPARADEVARWRPYIAEASARFGIPVAWIERVMRAESRGRPLSDGRPIRSPKGAIGLMQLMPGTWAEMRANLRLGPDPDAPRDNILAGTFYLRLMYDRFGYPGCFAAYNAGPGRYTAWLAGTMSLPQETTAYLSAVGASAATTPRANAPSTAVPTLFVVRGELQEPVASAPQQLAAAIFAIRKVRE
ncbi:lytic transglycosylase domain-containing protein [Sphingomonas sp.]|uniref:lytic transglycosylase domain-containing protein n=1 Tax=Sphingomonas sp. TaxID=28214 RepID=UPI003D6CE2DD